MSRVPREDVRVTCPHGQYQMEELHLVLHIQQAFGMTLVGVIGHLKKKVLEFSDTG